MKTARLYGLVLVGGLMAQSAIADTVQYTSSPGSYPLVTSGLFQEFGTASFPPVTETALSYYQVQGSGQVTLTFRFHDDTGSFLFNFGYYRWSPALDAIDTTTTTGKMAYAYQALAPGNAALIFNDVVDNPGAVRTLTLNANDVIGFFLIPDSSLSQFQSNPASFAVDGVGSATLGYPGLNRWPFFGLARANPGGLDQLMSFSGTSAATGHPSSMFAWEDLTRATIAGNPYPSDNAFNDLIFGVEGVSAVTPPTNPPNVFKSNITTGTNVTIGEVFSYAISFNTFSNATAAVSLHLVDQLPPEVDFLDTTTSGALSVVYDPPTHTIIWDFGTWPPLTAGPTNYVTVRVNANAIGQTNIVNLASMLSSNLPPITTIDHNPRCPTCPGVPVCASPALTVTPVANRGYYQIGATSGCYGPSQLQFYVQDTASAYVAGPYPSGTVIKIKKSATTGIGPASGPASVTIKVLGNGQVYVVDPAAQTSAPVTCLSL